MDIVKRLRDPLDSHDADDFNLHEDAADEIERLRKEYKRLMEERDKYSRMVTSLLDKYFDSATIRTTGGKG